MTQEEGGFDVGHLAIVEFQHATYSTRKEHLFFFFWMTGTPPKINRVNRSQYMPVDRQAFLEFQSGYHGSCSRSIRMSCTVPLGNVRQCDLVVSLVVSDSEHTYFYFFLTKFGSLARLV